MKPETIEPFFKALAGIKGRVDGREGSYPCDLSGTKPGRLTGTDILDQLEADAELTIPEEIKKAVLDSYAEAYNRVAGRGHCG